MTRSNNTARCRVCGESIDKASLDLPAPALTSTNELVSAPTRIYVCASCGHAQSPDLPDVAEFYDKWYKCALASDAFDQLCEIKNGVQLYRSDLQADLVLKTVRPHVGANILDYGAAKAATLRKIVTRRPDLLPHAYDVSEDYMGSWSSWLPSNSVATYTIPDSWHGRFELVTAHYVLEHVQDPVTVLRNISTLLAPNGRLYFCVPDWANNIGDLLVAEHTNHFTHASLQRAVREAGLVIDILDATSLPCAFVVVCHASDNHGAAFATGDIKSAVARARLAVSSLDEACKRIDIHLASNVSRHSAVFGAGFYGAFLLTRMIDRSGVACCIDNNPHLWGRELFGIPIVPPEHLPSATEIVYVALNPARGREIAASVLALKRPGLDLVFIDV